MQKGRPGSRRDALSSFFEGRPPREGAAGAVHLPAFASETKRLGDLLDCT